MSGSLSRWLKRLTSRFSEEKFRLRTADLRESLEYEILHNRIFSHDPANRKRIIPRAVFETTKEARKNLESYILSELTCERPGEFYMCVLFWVYLDWDLSALSDTRAVIRDRLMIRYEAIAKAIAALDELESAMELPLGPSEQRLLSLAWWAERFSRYDAERHPLRKARDGMISDPLDVKAMAKSSGALRFHLSQARSLILTSEFSAKPTIGRPKGGFFHEFTKRLSAVWNEHTGIVPTYSRRNGLTEGKFVRFCELSFDCLPVSSQRHRSLLESAIRATCDQWRLRRSE